MRTKGLFGLSMLCLLSAAILATIYLAWIFYPMEISWLKIDQAVPFAKPVIARNFEILMDYLTNPFDWSLDLPNFPSSTNGLHHFQQVKLIFHAVQVVFIVTLPAALLFIREVIAKGFLSLYSKSLLFLIALPLFIGGLAALFGFETFFVLFHKLLFWGDQTWLFDPVTDPVIWILPENFFLHAFLLFFSLYELSLIFLYFWAKSSYGVKKRLANFRN